MLKIRWSMMRKYLLAGITTSFVFTILSLTASPGAVGQTAVLPSKYAILPYCWVWKGRDIHPNKDLLVDDLCIDNHKNKGKVRKKNSACGPNNLSRVVDMEVCFSSGAIPSDEIEDLFVKVDNTGNTNPTSTVPRSGLLYECQIEENNGDTVPNSNFVARNDLCMEGGVIFEKYRDCDSRREYIRTLNMFSCFREAKPDVIRNYVVGPDHRVVVAQGGGGSPGSTQPTNTGSPPTVQPNTTVVLQAPGATNADSGDLSYRLPPGSSVTFRTRVTARDQLQNLTDLCGGGLEGLMAENGTNIEARKQEYDLANQESNQHAPAHATATANLKNACRQECLKKVATGSACATATNKASACKWLGPDDNIEITFSTGTKKPLAELLGCATPAYDSTVNACDSLFAYKSPAANASGAFTQVRTINSCMEEVRTQAEDQACKDAAVAWQDSFDKYAGALQKRDNLSAWVSGNGSSRLFCTRLSGHLVYTDYQYCSPEYLSTALSQCPRALADAEMRAQVEARNMPCANCGPGGGPGYYSRGQNAAAIIGAIGSIVTPIGLGWMQTALGHKAINSYSNLYQQQLQTCATVGIPCPAPSLFGMGLGGFGGGFAGGITGGFNGGFAGGITGGFNGGFAGGITGGIGMPMMGSILGGIGNVNAIVGGIGMPMMGGWGQPITGGWGNPMFGPNMMQGQNNMMGIQQQMYLNQIRMMEMAGQGATAAYTNPMMGAMNGGWGGGGWGGGGMPMMGAVAGGGWGGGMPMMGAVAGGGWGGGMPMAGGSILSAGFLAGAINGGGGWGGGGYSPWMMPAMGVAGGVNLQAGAIVGAGGYNPYFGAGGYNPYYGAGGGGYQNPGYAYDPYSQYGSGQNGYAYGCGGGYNVAIGCY